MQRVHEAHCQQGAPLVDGYAPFCKHLFVRNYTGAPVSALPITDANRHLLQSGGQCRQPLVGPPPAATAADARRTVYVLPCCRAAVPTRSPAPGPTPHAHAPCSLHTETARGACGADALVPCR